MVPKTKQISVPFPDSQGFDLINCLYKTKYRILTLIRYPNNSSIKDAIYLDAHPLKIPFFDVGAPLPPEIGGFGSRLC